MLTKELDRLEAHANAVLKALPELREADQTMTGIALVEAITEIGERYGLNV